MSNENRNINKKKKNVISKEESIIYQKARQIRKDKVLRKKMTIITAVFIVILSFLLGRVAYIKIAKGEEFEKIAVQQQISKLTDQSVSPLRGKILDRNGKTLAISNTIYTVVIDIRSMYDEGIKASDREKTMTTISEVLGIRVTCRWFKDTRRITQSFEVAPVGFELMRRHQSDPTSTILPTHLSPPYNICLTMSRVNSLR